MPYNAAEQRYEHDIYRRAGRSGLVLPRISLGLWHNFGEDKPREVQKAILFRVESRLKSSTRLGSPLPVPVPVEVPPPVVPAGGAT